MLMIAKCWKTHKCPLNSGLWINRHKAEYYAVIKSDPAEVYCHISSNISKHQQESTYMIAIQAGHPVEPKCIIGYTLGVGDYILWCLHGDKIT